MEDLLTLPVTGYEIAGNPALQTVVVSLDFIATPMDDPTKPQRRSFVLHSAQARQLAQSILDMSARVETAARRPGEAPAH